MAVNFNPHISVDCVVFGFDGNELNVLLINRDPVDRANPAERLKLPGDLLIGGEMLTAAAQRILTEFTGLHDLYLKQFGIFDDPRRLDSPDDLVWLNRRSGVTVERVVTVAYYSLVKIDKSRQTDLSVSYNARWYSCSSVPGLIFDHTRIIETGMEVLRRELLVEPLCFKLLPDKFTVNQLQRLYEAVLVCSLDNRNFRKKLQRLPYIVPLNERQHGVPHQPARLHIFDNEKYERLKKKQHVFIL